jgi:MFS family permease
MGLRAAGIWTRQPFALLWTGQTVSHLGSEITLVALPLTAIIVLAASPVQVGLLTASGFAFAALFGVFAGVWVDRLRTAPGIAALGTIAGAATLLRSPLWTGWQVLESWEVDDYADRPPAGHPTRLPARLCRFARGGLSG